MPWREWVVSFYDHPRAIELATGNMVHNRDGLFTGRQVGAIDLGKPEPPPIALDPTPGRFAVSGPDGVTVVTLKVSEQGTSPR